MHCIISTRRYLLSLFSERYKSIPLTIKKKKVILLFVLKMKQEKRFLFKAIPVLVHCAMILNSILIF